MVGKDTEVHSLSIEPLSKYTFSINDFSDAQLLKLQCPHFKKFQGNTVFKKRLCIEIDKQKSERNKFYYRVAVKRAAYLINEKFHLQIKLDQENEDNSLRFLQYWTPPESEKDIVEKKYPSINSLLGLPRGSESLPAFTRVKQSFLPSRYISNYSIVECAHNFNYEFVKHFTLAMSLVAGTMMGMEHGYRNVMDFDKVRSGKKFDNRFDAYRQRSNIFIVTSTRYLVRWGWRVAFILGSFSFISQSLTIYRKKDVAWHYVAAAAIPGALYKWKRGPKGMLFTSVLFACFFGLPFGLLFGTMGLNPRPILYHTYIGPYVDSPAHWLNWTDEQNTRNSKLMELLMIEINNDRLSDDNAKNSPLYKQLFPTRSRNS